MKTEESKTESARSGEGGFYVTEKKKTDVVKYLSGKKVVVNVSSGGEAIKAHLEIKGKGLGKSAFINAGDSHTFDLDEAKSSIEVHIKMVTSEDSKKSNGNARGID